MEFNPANIVVKRCLQGMEMEDKGKPDEAGKLFLQAWNEATDDFEKFIAAYYVARRQTDVADQLKWCETALRFALNLNDDSVHSAFPALYSSIAKCHETLNDPDNAKKHYALAASFADTPADKGPFYHGTKAALQIGDMLTAGRRSNYHSEIKMNHVYFTAMVNGAGFAAALVNGEGRERVYIVEPTGSFENDPNVTDKKFPGNPTRSYRTTSPVKVIGEVTDWVRLPPQELQKFREKLANSKGEIIN